MGLSPFSNAGNVPQPLWFSAASHLPHVPDFWDAGFGTVLDPAANPSPFRHQNPPLNIELMTRICSPAASREVPGAVRIPAGF